MLQIYSSGHGNRTETEWKYNGRANEYVPVYVLFAVHVRIDTNSGLCAARTISAACRCVQSVYAQYDRSRASPASNCMVSVY